MSKYYSLGLIGYPLLKSQSPNLHSAAIRSSNLMGEYKLYPIEPFPLGKDALFEIVERVRDGQLSGLNVTIPHKTNIIPVIDKLSPEAELIGAVNTLYSQDGVVFGDNTDATGFIKDLSRHFNRVFDKKSKKVEIEKKKALVLGAGGAARAVVFALLNAGWMVIIAARNPVKAMDIAHSYKLFANSDRIICIPLEKKSISIELHSINLVVNATPVGMYPDVNRSPWPGGLTLPPGAFIYDLVYKPHETKFIQTAIMEGLPAVNGIGMLVEQAALAFELWTGVSPSREIMSKAVEH